MTPRLAIARYGGFGIGVIDAAPLGQLQEIADYHGWEDAMNEAVGLLKRFGMTRDQHESVAANRNLHHV